MGGRARLKRALAHALAGPDWRGTAGQFQDQPPHRLTSALLAALSSADEREAWRAAAVLAVVMAGRDQEAGREVLRRLVWTLNEESGSIVRAAPAAMAEIMARQPGLAREFASLLLSYVTPGGCFLDYPPLQQSVIWGLGRLARELPGVLKGRDIAAALIPFLRSPDAALRGAAVWALEGAGAGEAREEIQGLTKDQNVVRIMEEGEPVSRTVAELARNALHHDA